MTQSSANPPPSPLLRLWHQVRDWNRVRTRRTFVVLGCPRGGTSLLAGILDAAGVYMGDYPTAQYEDPEFQIPIGEASQARRRLAPVIAQRNAAHTYWGWKLPDTIYYIDMIRDLLIDPCYLFIYRDPERIARCSARYDGRDWAALANQLRGVADRHTRLIRTFQSAAGQGHPTFQLEEIHADPAAFVDRLTGILAPLQPDRNRLLRFVDPTGGYRLHDGVAADRVTVPTPPGPP